MANDTHEQLLAFVKELPSDFEPFGERSRETDWGYVIRGQRIMLDADLASIYVVSTKALNQAVKRNEKRFPEDFMFRLTADELEEIRSTDCKHHKPVTSCDRLTEDGRFEVTICDLKGSRGRCYLPYAFTRKSIQPDIINPSYISFERGDA